MDGLASVKAQWQHDIDYSNEIEIENCTTITELIQRFRAEGYTMSMPCTSIQTITMQSHGYIEQLHQLDHVKSFTDAEMEVNRWRTNNEILINKPRQFQAMFLMNTPADLLQICWTSWILSITSSPWQRSVVNWYIYAHARMRISHIVVSNP